MSDTEEIKSRLPVEQVVGQYVPLRRAGRIQKGLCPFHNEKTPSFTVNPERGIFKCFGCGEGGDIFDFVMKIEGLTFGETVRLLAEKAGVTLEDWKPDRPEQQPSGPPKNRLFELNAYTAKLWHTLLMKHPKAEPAREYLRRRGLADEALVTFQIGYAPMGSVTAQTLRNAGFSLEEIRAAGDPTKFQDRIVFPITDLTGKIIGFTGRLLEVPGDTRPPASLGPKYWNTPETPIFYKSRAVFALHLAKRAIQDEELFLLAEGQMDVVMLHQAGYRNAVASSGTALTADQLRLLSRFSRTFAFAYDGDKAGIEATKKGIELALEQELVPYVVTIPSGKDPADCLKSDPEAWKSAYEARIPYMQWLLNEVMAGQDTNDPIIRKKVVTRLLPWLAKIKDPVEQNEWIRQISSPIRTNEQALREALQRVKTTGEPGRSAVSSPAAAAPQPSAVPVSPLTSQAELALALLLSFPNLVPTLGQEVVQTVPLVPASPFIEQILPILTALPEGTEFTGQVEERIGEGSYKETLLKVEELLKPYEDTDLSSTEAVGEIMALCRRIRSEAKANEKQSLAQRIQAAQQAGDKDTVHKLFSELKNLV